MWIDSHTHLDCLDLDRAEAEAGHGEAGSVIAHYWRGASSLGLAGALCVNITWEHWPRLKAWVRAAGGGTDAASLAGNGGLAPIWTSIGVHPNEQDGHDPTVAELLEQAAQPGVVAIGETGLDFYRVPEAGSEWQRQRFSRHISAARQAGLPLIIHTRQSAAATLDQLKAEGAEAVGGVMHCFVEDYATACRALDLGFYISFSGILTFPKAPELRELAARLPLDRLLVETDAPYLAPKPHRGRPNFPHYVRHTGECLAEVLGMAPEAVAEQVAENFFRCFPKAAVPQAPSA